MVSYRSVFITSLILIILLPIGFIWTVLEFRAIDKDGMYCQKQPFIWGAWKIAEQYDNPRDVHCSCMMSNGRTFSFNKTAFVPGRTEINVGGDGSVLENFIS